MSGDVLEEHPLRGDFIDGPGDVRPEVAGVILALSVAAERERLAGITGSDEMNAATPGATVEGLEIVPNRSCTQGRVRHPGHESGRGETVSLDIAHSSVSGFCDMQSEIKSGDTGAKADAANFVMSFGGTKSHMEPLFRCDLVALLKGSGVASNW